MDGIWRLVKRECYKPTNAKRSVALLNPSNRMTSITRLGVTLSSGRGVLLHDTSKVSAFSPKRKWRESSAGHDSDRLVWIELCVVLKKAIIFLTSQY